MPQLNSYRPLIIKHSRADPILSGSAFCWVDIGLPEQAVGWFPLALGLVVEDGAFMECHWTMVAVLGAKFRDLWFYLPITCDFHVEAMRMVWLVFGTVTTKQDEKQAML